MTSTTQRGFKLDARGGRRPVGALPSRAAPEPMPTAKAGESQGDGQVGRPAVVREFGVAAGDDHRRRPQRAEHNQIRFLADQLMDLERRLARRTMWLAGTATLSTIIAAGLALHALGGSAPIAASDVPVAREVGDGTARTPLLAADAAPSSVEASSAHGRSPLPRKDPSAGNDAAQTPARADAAARGLPPVAAERRAAAGERQEAPVRPTAPGTRRVREAGAPPLAAQRAIMAPARPADAALVSATRPPARPLSHVTTGAMRAGSLSPPMAPPMAPSQAQADGNQRSGEASTPVRDGGAGQAPIRPEAAAGIPELSTADARPGRADRTLSLIALEAREAEPAGAGLSRAPRPEELATPIELHEGPLAAASGPRVVPAAQPRRPGVPALPPLPVAAHQGLPGGVPIRVAVTFPRGASDGRTRAVELAGRLREEGLSVLEPTPAPVDPGKPAITYFFTEDAAGAAAVERGVAGVLGKTGVVKLSQRGHLDRPGMILVSLPSKLP